jgi:predicted ATPase
MGAKWIEGRCVSYGRTIPYHLVIDLVRAMLGMSPTVGTDAEDRAALARRLDELLGQGAADALPYLAHLVGLELKETETDRVQLDPETLQSRYVAAISRVIRALSTTSPVVVVCEDVHWADPVSIEVMIQLLPFLTQLPVLTLFACRAETDAPGDKSAAALGIR